MSQPQPVKRATIKDPQGKIDTLILFRKSKGDYRWVFPTDGKEFDGVAYLAEEDAIRALRVKVEGDPQFVGYDLTVYPIDPTPVERTAEKLVDAKTLLIGGVGFIREEAIRNFAQIIEQETNLPALLDAFQVLLAHCFKLRRTYAKAQFPSVEGQEPRDLVLDGLLLTCVEEIEKSLKQDFTRLKQPLMEPTSRIVTASGKLKPGGRIQ